MNNLLKGNYDLADKSSTDVSLPTERPKGFEDQAMERLGGSIAFIMKGDKFIWDEESEDEE